MTITKPKQAKPLLKNSNSNVGGQKASARMIRQIFVFGVISIFTLLFVSLHLAISSTHSLESAKNTPSERHLPPDAFPKFQDHFRTMPEAFGDGAIQHSAEDLTRAWTSWAEPPIFGSYQYSPTSSIHFPRVDLQTYYNKNKSNDSNGLKGTGVTVTGGMRLPFPAQMKGITPVDSDFSLLTRKGNKAEVSGVRSNQDRVVIVSPLLGTAGAGSIGNNWWLGLFDGHGEVGEVTSHFASVEFPRLLHERLSNVQTSDTEKVVAVLKDTFLDVHASLPKLNGAGSTGISMLRFGPRFYVSNCGDSEALVVRYDPANIDDIKVVYQTIPHKPDTPAEAARIQAAGGGIIPKPNYPGATARVLVPMPDGMDMALAMSRSLGDHEADPVGVIAEPTTDALDLDMLRVKSSKGNPYEYVVIAASDGLFDKVPISKVSKYVVKSLLAGSDVNILEASEQLILLSSQEWYQEDPLQHYRDDISLAIHKLRI